MTDDKESKMGTNASVTQEAATPEDVARKIITDTFGAKSNRDDLPRIIQLTNVPQVDGTLTLDCRLRINYNLTQNYIVLGFINNVRRAMQKLFADSKLTDYSEFRFYGAFPMQDMYGNVQV